MRWKPHASLDDALGAVAWLAGGCRERNASNPTGPVDPQSVLAKVDDTVITAADLKELLARHGSQPFVLARYSSIEKKKELLGQLDPLPGARHRGSASGATSAIPRCSGWPRTRW